MKGAGAEEKKCALPIRVYSLFSGGYRLVVGKPGLAEISWGVVLATDLKKFKPRLLINRRGLDLEE